MRGELRYLLLNPIHHTGESLLIKTHSLGLKNAFNEAMRKFNRSICGRGITKSEFFSLFNIAWEKAMTPANIKAGFKRTGIWPISRAAIHSYVSEPYKMCEQKSCGVHDS